MIAKKTASADAAIKKARRAGHRCRWKKDLRRRNNCGLLLSSVLLIVSAILVSSRRAEMELRAPTRPFDPLRMSKIASPPAIPQAQEFVLSIPGPAPSDAGPKHIV